VALISPFSAAGADESPVCLRSRDQMRLKVSPPSSTIGCPAVSAVKLAVTARSRGGAIERHRYRQPTGVDGCIASRDVAQEYQDAFPYARVSVFSPGDAASCVAPCPPRLLPRGRLARDRRGLIDGAISPLDGCASIVLPQWRRRDFLPLR
jgi:hypothetical protein